MRLFLVSTIMMMSCFARAVNVSTSDVSSQVAEKKWHILFDINHQPTVRDDQFMYTDFTLFFDYQLNPSHSFRILQAPTKKYELGLEQGEEEWSPSDTILNHFWNTGWSIGPTRFRWVTALNLPTSLDSQDNQKVLTFGGTLQANTMFWGKLLVSLRPYFRYNWYEYKTRESGRPLPALLTGINMVNSYNVTDKFSLNATLGYTVVYDYASEYDSSLSIGGLDDNSTGRYSVDLSANYSFTDKFGAYVGYSQGDAYIRDGRYELYAYDPQVTRYSIGATFYF